MELVQSVPGLWLQLLFAAAVILFAAQHLARHADIIAFRTGLGRSFIGVVLLATATSMPELGTGVSSITLVDDPDLAAGDAFGSNLFNLLIIGVLDIFWRRGPILNSVGVTPAVVAGSGVFVISIAALAIFMHEHSLQGFANWHISPITIILLGAFLIGMYAIYKSAGAAEGAEGEEEGTYNYGSVWRSALVFAGMAALIVAASIWLANIGESIAHAMNWEASFVGTQFLALSTSLPEFAASFAALRINAPQLAIANLLGSNLFNMGFILAMDDVALVGSPLWSSISSIHELTAMFAVLMTAIVVMGIATQRRTKPSKYFTYEGLSLIGLYILASVLVFQFG